MNSKLLYLIKLICETNDNNNNNNNNNISTHNKLIKGIVVCQVS